MDKAQIHRCSENRTRLCLTQFHGRAFGVAGVDVLRATQPPALANVAAPSRPRRRSQGLFRCFWRHLRLSWSARPAGAETAWRSRKRLSRGVDGPAGLQGRVRNPRWCLTRAGAQVEELPDLLGTGFHR